MKNMMIIGPLNASFARAYTLQKPATMPTLDKATQDALKVVQDNYNKIGRFSEATANALKEFQDNYNKIGTFGEAAANTMKVVQDNYNKIGRFSEVAAYALKAVQDNYSKIGFSSSTVFANAFKNVNKQIPENYMEASAFFDDVTMAILDNQVSEITAVAAEIEKLPVPNYEYNINNNPTDSDDSKETNTDLDVSENLMDGLGATKTIGGITVIETKEGYQVTNSRGQTVNYPKISIASVT